MRHDKRADLQTIASRQVSKERLPVVVGQDDYTSIIEELEKAIRLLVSGDDAPAGLAIERAQWELQKVSRSRWLR